MSFFFSSDDVRPCLFQEILIKHSRYLLSGKKKIVGLDLSSQMQEEYIFLFQLYFFFISNYFQHFSFSSSCQQKKSVLSVSYQLYQLIDCTCTTINTDTIECTLDFQSTQVPNHMRHFIY